MSLDNPHVLPETFLEQVQQVLEHLYDFPYLQRHPLAHTADSKSITPETAGQQLRHEFIEAIESLNPDKNLFFREPQARLYHLLYFYYVEGLSVDDVATELGLSTRQVYRDLKKGQMRVAEITWAARQGRKVTASMIDLSSVKAEVSRLKLNLQPVRLSDLIQSAQAALARLAMDRGVELRLDIPTASPMISTDVSVAQQILVDVLSQVINCAQGQAVQLTARSQPDGASLDIRTTIPNPDQKALPRPVVMELIAQLKWQLDASWQDDTWIIKLDMMSRHNVVLMIDDNKALAELVDRYLTSHNCQVVTALNGDNGWDLAQRLTPDAIILDVMMPNMDGWELLQRLRSHPATSMVPVIICSVFNNPELAYSLGADYFLPKPIKQEDILSCLSELGLV